MLKCRYQIAKLPDEALDVELSFQDQVGSFSDLQQCHLQTALVPRL